MVDYHNYSPHRDFGGIPLFDFYNKKIMNKYRVEIRPERKIIYTNIKMRSPPSRANINNINKWRIKSQTYTNVQLSKERKCKAKPCVPCNKLQDIVSHTHKSASYVYYYRFGIFRT